MTISPLSMASGGYLHPGTNKTLAVAADGYLLLEGAVTQPVGGGPSTGASAGGHSALRRKPRKPRIEAYTPIWEHFEDELVNLVTKKGDQPKDRDEIIKLLSAVSVGSLEDVTKSVFKLHLRGFDAVEILDLLYFLPEGEKSVVHGLLRQRLDDDAVAVLLLEGAL